MKDGTTHLAYKPEHAVGLAPSEDVPCVVVADKGYHAREQLKALDGGVWKTRIAEPEPCKGYLALAWRRGGAQSGLRQSRAAEIGYRARDHAPARRPGRALLRPYPRSPRQAPRLAARAGELHKRYLIHVAGFNLGVLMRALYGQGTSREAAETLYAPIIVLRTEAALVFALIATVDGELAAIVIVAADPTRN